MFYQLMVTIWMSAWSVPSVLPVDGYNMDERLERSWRIVYYQVSGELGIAGCNAMAVRSSR